MTKVSGFGGTETQKYWVNVTQYPFTAVLLQQDNASFNTRFLADQFTGRPFFIFFYIINLQMR